MAATAARPLEGRCALITGSSAGIGLDTAKVLASMGADVVMNASREREGIKEICASLERDYSIRAVFHVADMASSEQVVSLVKAAQDHGRGRLDILVNNAGYAIDAAIESFTLEEWERMVAVNLTAPFIATRSALPAMREQNWGRIVNVASVHGLVGFPLRTGYCSTKHGLVGLTKVVALETAGTAVTCNVVCPGLVGTERVLEMHGQRAVDAGVPLEALKQQVMTYRQPSGNYIASEDVAAAIAYLCGPHASEVRGTTLALDGGWTAR